MSDGWIKLWRKISDSEFWFLDPFSRAQAWIDLLILANHKDADGFDARKRVKRYEVGKVYHSVLELSQRWKWSRGRTTRFLKMLVESNMILFESDTTNGTTITILNWKEYQQDFKNGQQIEQQMIQQTDNKRTTNGTKTRIIKNNKEEEKEKEKESCVPEGAALQDDAERLTEIPEAYRERFGNDIEAFRRWASS